MIKYPRIYSISTVGVRMHYNQDYLLHPIRTDFTGKNGIGKSLIADFFQILFIADKKRIAFGTESNKSNTRQIETLPYRTSDAYVFINIEIDKNYFISLGVNIPNKKSRPLRSFWVLNKPYGKDDDEDLIDLAIPKNNIPFHKDFLLGNTIPPIEKLMIKLREEKKLYLRNFSDRIQKNEFFSFLFEKEILPINLAIDNNLDAFAKVIQSFSKAKTLNTDSDESLKSFLFDGNTDEIQSEYEKHKKDLERLITDYKDLDSLITTLENKQEALKNLSSLNDLYLSSFKEHLTVEYVQIEDAISKKEKSLNSLNKQVTKENQAISILQTKNPKLKNEAAEAKKAYQIIEKSLTNLYEYKDVFDKIEALKTNITELENIKLPAVASEPLVDIPNVDAYEIVEIKRRIKDFNKVFEKYGSIKKIEQQVELQQDKIGNRKNTLTSKKSDLHELLNLLSKNKKNTLFGLLISEQKTLSKAQETILFHTLQDIYWEKPEEVITGIRYATNLEFINEKHIKEDIKNEGYWFDLGGVKEFISFSKDKQVFGEKKMLEKALTNQRTKINNDITDVDKELSEIESFFRGDIFKKGIIKVDMVLDQSTKDFSQLNDMKLTLGLIQNISVKKDAYLLEISKKEKEIFKVEKKITIKISKTNLSGQIETLENEVDTLKQKELELDSKYKTDQVRLGEKLNFLPTLQNQPQELQNTIEELKKELAKVTKDFSKFFSEFDLKTIDESQFIDIEKTPIFSEFQNKKTNYIGDYKSMIKSFPEIKNAPEIVEQVDQETFNFEIIETTLLGPKIKHTGNITEELKQLNSSRFRMFDAIHETMLSIFKQTKGKFDEYHNTVKALNKFFKGKKISDKYYFQLEFNSPPDFDINWINQLQMSSQQVHKNNELPMGDSVEKFVENFFTKATGFGQRIKFSNLLDPKTYFELKTKFTDEFDVEKPDGSTGENYTAIVLLGIGRLSVVLSANRPGLRFLILEEVSNLDSLNFSTFPNIAEEFGYQILTMTPRPFGSDTKQGWYLHHLIEGAGDKNINYPVPNSYFKTNEGREDLEIYLKSHSN